jgi:hypothetical protein
MELGGNRIRIRPLINIATKRLQKQVTAGAMVEPNGIEHPSVAEVELEPPVIADNSHAVAGRGFNGHRSGTRSLHHRHARILDSEDREDKASRRK